MTETTLDHVVIAVSDWNRSNVFYAEVPGAEVAMLVASAKEAT
jgi:catechol 2,3-dioxygenase-like lactoylglutathione lyase family enzyme